MMYNKGSYRVLGAPTGIMLELEELRQVCLCRVELHQLAAMHWCFLLFVLAGVRAIKKQTQPNIVVLFVDGEHALSVSPITRPSTADPIYSTSSLIIFHRFRLRRSRLHGAPFHPNTQPG